MQAIRRSRYGGPGRLRLEELPTPNPGSGQVRIAVAAAGLNKADVYMLRGQPFFIRFDSGLFRPKYRVPGADVAGTVDAVGRGTGRFKEGDQVFADLSAGAWGAFAESVVAPEGSLARAPGSIPLVEAAAVPMAGVTAYQALHHKAGVQPGDRVLVYGASGGVGTFALQLAKAAGAHVTAVSSTRNLEQAKRLGADAVHDYTKGFALPNEPTYEAILGVNGFNEIKEYEAALRPGGCYVCIGGTGKAFMQGMMEGKRLSKRTGKRLGFLSAKPNTLDLAAVASLIDEGKVRPVIDRTFPLAEAADAFRYVADGHARAKVLVTV